MCRDCCFASAPESSVSTRPATYFDPPGPDTPDGIQKPHISVVLDNIREDEQVVHTFFRKPLSTSGTMVSRQGAPSTLGTGVARRLTYLDTKNFLVIRKQFSHFTVEYKVRKKVTCAQKRTSYYALNLSRRRSDKKNFVKNITLLTRKYIVGSPEYIPDKFRFILKPLFFCKGKDIESLVKADMMQHMSLTPYKGPKDLYKFDVYLPDTTLSFPRRPQTRSYGEDITQRLLTLGEFSSAYDADGVHWPEF